MIKYYRYEGSSNLLYEFIIASPKGCFVYDIDKKRWEMIIRSANQLFAENVCGGSGGSPATMNDLSLLCNKWRESSKLEVLLLCGAGFLKLIE